jgi:hypothetical protein
VTPRQRPTVPATSPIAGERTPLTPQVENIISGSQTDETSPEQQKHTTKPRTAAVTDSGTPAVPDSGTTPGGQGPKWAALERKEARLRTDQITALAALRRHIAAQRRDKTEIITDNTLIRVAVDLLLASTHRLHGDTEEALLHSVLPRRRTPRQ